MQDRPANRPPSAPIWMRLGVLGFGLFALAFLAVLERPHWFHGRPAVGTTVAMSSTATASADAHP